MNCQGNKNCTQPLKNDVLKKTFISVERLREARTLSSMPYKLIEACKPMLNLTRITLGEVNGTPSVHDRTRFSFIYQLSLWKPHPL